MIRRQLRTGLPPDLLARLSRLPIVSIAVIRGRATGAGSELAFASDRSGNGSFATFDDLNGNRWRLQEITIRLHRCSSRVVTLGDTQLE